VSGEFNPPRQLNPVFCEEGSMELSGSRLSVNGLSDSDVAVAGGMYRDVWCQLNPILNYEGSMEISENRLCGDGL
jgi:hypothetical protein